MPVLAITKTYADGDTLFEADLDNIKDDLENFLNVTKLNDDNIQNSGITASTKLVDATVTSAKIASAAITTSKISDDAVTTAKIVDANITTAKILDANVTTAKLADASVTQAKRAALGQQISASCGLFTTASTSYVDVTNLSVSITTTGRPVMCMLVPDGGSISAEVGSEGAFAGGVNNLAPYCGVRILRDAVTVGETAVQAAIALTNLYLNNLYTRVPPGAITAIDTPIAGTYTYKIQAFKGATSSNVQIQYCKLVAFEL